MIEHGTVESTVKPEPLTIDEYSVWVATDIKDVKTEKFEGFSYALTQYLKDEYILELVARDTAKADALMELSEMVAEMVAEMAGGESNG